MAYPVAELEHLLVLLLAATLFGKLAARVGQPVVIGHIIAGVVVGPGLLGLVASTPDLQLLADLGAILLLFIVGLETDLGAILGVGTTVLAVAIFGVAAPLGATVLILPSFGYNLDASLFAGAALVATSVGVTSATLRALGLLNRAFAGVILGAAVIDDVLGMLILAFVTGPDAGANPGQLVVRLATSLTFIAALFFGLPLVVRKGLSDPRLHGLLREPLLPTLLFALAAATLAEHTGLAGIIGAFLAGAALSPVKNRLVVQREIEAVYTFLAPFFFALIGAQVDVGRFLNPRLLGLTALITFIAIVSKALGAGLGAVRLGSRNALIVGVGMVPRGEVGLIVAEIGNQLGLLVGDLFTALVAMSVLTTLVVPKALSRLAR